MDKILYQKKYLILIIALGFLFTSCETESDDIPSDPVTMKGLVNEGWQHYANGDFESAIESFNNALERNVEPDSLGLKAYQGLGWAYSRINRYSQSISSFNFLQSVESLNSGKYPIVEREDVVAISKPVITNPAVYDTFGRGDWIIDLGSENLLLSVSDIESYSAERIWTVTVGGSPKVIVQGSREFTLDRAPISDRNGEGIGDGSELDFSLHFEAAINPETDSLVYPVANVSDIDTIYRYDTLLTTLSEYHLDAMTGIVTIKPRHWPIRELNAIFQYYEKTYMVRNFSYNSISMEELLEDEATGFPVLDPENYYGGDKYYVDGEFFNLSDGGTYIQLDAFAGMAAGFVAQREYESAVRAARTAIFINEYLKENDPDNYPYARRLFDGDTGFDMWNVYHLLAFSYFNLLDFYYAEQCLEIYMGQGDVLDPISPAYENDLVRLLSNIQQPAGWTPVEIW